MMNGDRDLVVGNFVLANTTSFSITQDGIAKSNGIRSPKSETGYCRSLKHGPIGPRIASTPHMSSKIFPIKDFCPMEFINLRDILVWHA